MADSYLDRTLALSLSAASLRYLPAQRKDGDERYWTKAVVRVRRMGGIESYALVRRGGDGVMRYVRDFGGMRPIVGVLNIHPYQWVDYDIAGWCDDEEHLRARLIDDYRDRMDMAARVAGVPGSREYERAIRQRDDVLVRIANAGADELRRYDIDRIIAEMDRPRVGSPIKPEPELREDMPNDVGEEKIVDVTADEDVVVRNAPPRRRVKGSKTDRARKPRRVPKNAITGREDGEVR